MKGPYLTSREAAAYIGSSPATLRRWRSEGRGPEFVRPPDGGHPRYPLDSLEEWLKEGEKK